VPDYGHEIWFAAGLNSPSRGARQVVALAEHADRARLDLAAFMDHPYQPAYLDTWTLLSYLAARTRRIRLASSVHPVPLRPPALLARAAASLDILSGGRFELGLGAGQLVGGDADPQAVADGDGGSWETLTDRLGDDTDHRGVDGEGDDDFFVLSDGTHGLFLSRCCLRDRGCRPAASQSPSCLPPVSGHCRLHDSFPFRSAAPGFRQASAGVRLLGLGVGETSLGGPRCHGAAGAAGGRRRPHVVFHRGFLPVCVGEPCGGAFHLGAAGSVGDGLAASLLTPAWTAERGLRPEASLSVSALSADQGRDSCFVFFTTQPVESHDSGSAPRRRRTASLAFSRRFGSSNST
jgi:hypothetical protein